MLLNSLHAVIAAWLNVSQEVELVLEWTCMPGIEMLSILTDWIPHYMITYLYHVLPLLLASNVFLTVFYRYITQFREIFTEEGRRQVKITHQVGEIVATFNGAHHS